MRPRDFCKISRILLAVVFLAGSFTNLPALEKKVTISVYQGPCEDGDFAANLETVRQQIRLAEQRGSDFVAFPETFLSGYDSPENVRRGARRLDDPEIAAFINESARHDMVVIVGLAVLDNEKNLHNTVLVIHRGILLGTYSKCMLTGGDRNRLNFLPGTDIPVFTAHGAKFAVIICYDTSFPHPAMIARLKGAEILFTPHYNNIKAREMDAHLKVVRNNHIGLAVLLKLVVARPNVVIADKPGSLGYGHSFIVSPQGEMLAEADLFRTELVTATVGPETFKMPFASSDLGNVPAWMRKNLADLLLREGEE